MKQAPVIWVDGEPAAALPLPDRGLDFGDGLFETLLLKQGRPLFPELHLERLAAGLEVLGFPPCSDRAGEQLAQCAAQLAGHPWAALRLTVTRGAAPRGYASPDQPRPRTVISAAPLNQDRSLFPAPLTLAWAQIRWASQPALAGLKHLNRLEQVMAANEAKRSGSDDVVVLDASGGVSSLSSANLFLVERGRLLTPALETCGIAGTRRRLVLQRLAAAAGMEAHEGPVSPGQLLSADEVFCCNSIRGLQPVSQLAEARWRAFPVCRQLHRHYLEAIA